jgi:WD40 repeat protein
MPSYRYPGPRPFEENDIKLFFGREKDKKNLLTFINVEPLLVLFSKSGLGKSSLVNAAIIPELRKKDYEIIVCRFNSYVNKERDENISAEQQSPLQKLFSEVKIRQNTSATFLDTVIKNPEPFSLWHQFKNLQISDNGKKVYFIFFDQFEELFTYLPEQVKEFKEHLAELLGVSIPQEYLDQINQLEEDTASSDLTDEQLGLLYDPIPVKMLCTIRSDKFSLLTNLKDAIPGVVTKTYELKPFNTQEATDAIVKPASIENSLTGGDFISNSFAYDADAIKKMLNYLSDDGTENIESFQLQVLCRYVEDMVIENKKKNSELKNITANQLGDIKNIFEAYYNRLIEGIDRSKIKNVKRLFEEGLIFEKDKIRVPLYKGQITSNYGIDEVLLEKLVNTHLIRSEQDTNGKEKYELSHDSLIEPILKAKEKRVAEEKAALQKIKFKMRVQLFAAVIIGVVLIFGTAIYIFSRSAKRDKLEINFLVAEKDWFYLLDAAQRTDAMKNNFLFLINKDSVKYNRLKYSYKCAAYANQNAETNYSMELKFAQEGFLKDSTNAVIKRSFNNLIHKPNIYIPSLKIKGNGLINNTHITSDQQYVIAATTEGIFWYNTRTGALQDSLTSPDYKCDYSAFSPDGKYLLTESYYGESTHLVNLANKEYITIRNNYLTQPHSIAFDIATNNAFFIHSTGSDTVDVISIDGTPMRKYIFPVSLNDNINEVSISPDNNFFAAGTSYGEVFLVDLRNPNSKNNPLLLTTPDKKNLHSDIVNSISFSHDGNFLLTGSSDQKVQIWDIKGNNVFQTISGLSPVTKCRFSQDGDHILIGENKSGMITRWTKQKQNAGNLQPGNGRNIQYDSSKFNKDTLQLFGLDSNITSVNFYNNDLKLIASSYHEVSLWNLNSNKTFPLEINAVVKAGIVPQFSLADKINWKLVTTQDLISLTGAQDLFKSIKLLNDSLDNLNAKPDGIKENKQIFTELTDLIPKLFDRLKDSKEDPLHKLEKLDTFDVNIYTGNSYYYKILMDEDSLNGRIDKEHLEKMIAFRQAPFKLDTMYHKCFEDLFSAYFMPISYYFKNKQYDSALLWTDRILQDNPRLNNIKEIQNDVTIVNQYQVSFHILNNDLSGAKQAFKNWPANNKNINYILTKELVDIFTEPGHSFNKNKFAEALTYFNLKDDNVKQNLTDMDAIAYRLLEEKDTRKLSANTFNNLTEFDNYIYSFIK